MEYGVVGARAGFGLWGEWERMSDWQYRFKLRSVIKRQAERARRAQQGESSRGEEWGKGGEECRVVLSDIAVGWGVVGQVGVSIYQRIKFC